MRDVQGMLLLMGLGLVLAVVAMAGLAVGPVELQWSLLLPREYAGADTQSLQMLGYVLLELRLPRLLAAVLIGAGLAMAGTVTQGLFRNPLADPGLIGVSSGAALGAVSVIVLGSWLPWQPLPFVMLPIAAFAGGLLATLLVCMVAGIRGQSNTGLLLLAGIAINALAGAVTGLLAYIANDNQLRDMTLWSMGSVARVSWQQLAVITPMLVLACLLLLRQHRALNSLLLGEDVAAHIGHAIPLLKRIIILMTALIVGAAVAVAGVIGFIGLMTPHVARAMVGADHRWVMPVAMLMGAILLVLADILARTIAAPAEVPVGLLMALMGAPFFLYLLIQQRRKILI